MGRNEAQIKTRLSKRQTRHTWKKMALLRGSLIFKLRRSLGIMARKRKARKVRKQRRSRGLLIKTMNLRKVRSVDTEVSTDRKVRARKHRSPYTPQTSHPTSITIQNPNRKCKDPKSKHNSTPTNHPRTASKTAA